MDKKKLARMEMIKKLAKEKANEGMSDIGNALKSKKLSKVEVVAKDEKGLREGLSKAQQILSAKLGQNIDQAGQTEESQEEANCNYCEGEGCEHCDEEEESDEE